MIDNPYIDSNLKYPLSQEEYEIIDRVWSFLHTFNKNYISASNYRNKIINNIKEKYNIEEFLQLEIIAEKMFWNLRWILCPLFTKISNRNIFPESLTLCKIKNYMNDEHLAKLIEENNFLKDNYFRSFINKIVIINKKKQRVIFKPMEGSSPIFRKNYFNLLSTTIFSNRELYEKALIDPSSIINTIALPKFYFQYDYAFPNLNLCSYNFIQGDDRKDRVYKMYYNNNAQKQWFKLLK